MTTFLPLNSFVIYLKDKRMLELPLKALSFLTMLKLSYICIFFFLSTLYLRTEFKEANLYLQFDFIVFMHSFRSHYFPDRGWANWADA